MMSFHKRLLAATMIGINSNQSFINMIEVGVTTDSVNCPHYESVQTNEPITEYKPELTTVHLQKVAASSAKGTVTAWVGMCPVCKKVYMHA